MMKICALCVQGMVQAAAYISKKIKDEQLLTPAFNSDLVYIYHLWQWGRRGQLYLRKF